MSSTYNTRAKLFGFLMVLFCIFLTGCGETNQENNVSNEAKSDLMITPDYFINKYNALLDNVAQKDGKNYNGLKIEPNEISGANGVFQTKDKSCIIGWAKSDANTPNMCYMRFSIQKGTELAGTAMVTAVMAASANVGTEKAVELFNKENTQKQRTKIKDKGIIFDMHTEKNSISCVVADENYYNSIAKIKCHEDGNKVYCLDTDTIIVGLGGWHTVNVSTMSTDMNTVLETYTWTFLHDENVTRYTINGVNGVIEHGKVADNALATSIYSTLKQNIYLARHTYIAQDNGKQAQKQAPHKISKQIRNNNSNSSNEVYVGTYDSGLKAYLLADTLKMDSLRDFTVKIKAVDDDGNVVFVDYDFSGSPGEPDTWRNSQGYSGKVDYDNPSVETNIHNYHSKKWSDYVINYKPGNIQ